MPKKYSVRLSLEALDGRIVPSGTPVAAPEEQTVPVSTAPPVTTRTAPQIQADITALTQVITRTEAALAAGQKQEAALAVNVRLAKISYEEAAKVAIAVNDDPNATLQQKLQSLLNAFDERAKYADAKTALATQKDANLSTQQNLIGLKAMLADLKAELAAVQGLPTLVNTGTDDPIDPVSADDPDLALDPVLVDALTQAWTALGNDTEVNSWSQT